MENTEKMKSLIIYISLFFASLTVVKAQNRSYVDSVSYIVINALDSAKTTSEIAVSSILDNGKTISTDSIFYLGDVVLVSNNEEYYVFKNRQFIFYYNKQDDLKFYLKNLEIVAITDDINCFELKRKKKKEYTKYFAYKNSFYLETVIF